MRPIAFHNRLALPLAAGIAGLVVLSSTVYTVQPNEYAGVRRFGHVLNAEPIGPGLHLKLPLVDQVDRLPVSINQFKVLGQNVYTIDNQKVTLDLSMTYAIPREAVMKLLYGVGQPGNIDVDDNIRPIVADRALRIFAKRNTISLSEQRDEIGIQVQQDVTQRLAELFGIRVIDFQISRIEYSAQFVASVEVAVKAKNDAVAAENTVNRIRYEGQQSVVKAEADAKAQLARADAERQAAILAAQGEAEAIRLRGEAEAVSIAKRGQAIRENPQIVNLTLAERWSGTSPATVIGSGGSTAAPFIKLDTGRSAEGK
jgi:regulator of protease activity HflC (stomatin/prohibitin superfamily)